MFIVLSLKNLLSHWVRLILTKNIKVSVQLFRSLHINQQSHMISNYLVKVVEQNECNSTLQKWQKPIHYRNSSGAWKAMLQPEMCLSAKQLPAMPAKQRCDFHHNSMRSRQIFEVIDYLNSAHFVLQNRFAIVCFTYWMQMLLRCEIDEIAKRVRNHWFDAKISQSYQIWF